MEAIPAEAALAKEAGFKKGVVYRARKELEGRVVDTDSWRSPKNRWELMDDGGGKGERGWTMATEVRARDDVRVAGGTTHGGTCVAPGCFSTFRLVVTRAGVASHRAA